MMNATVATTVTSIDGQVGMVQYKDGAQQLLIGPEASSRDERQPGAPIAIVRALKTPDGTYEAERVHVGRDGVVPKERFMEGVA
jgi:hypothetical protein